MTLQCSLPGRGRSLTRITLRLPDDLHRRLSAASEQYGTSLNQLIVAMLNGALAHDDLAASMEDLVLAQVQQIRRAMGDLVVEIDADFLPPGVRPREHLPDSDTLRQGMPTLHPPLSATIIADREDRL
jgi:hypothetical protein